MGWSFALPFFAMFVVFMAGPILVSLVTSFTDLRVTDITLSAARKREITLTPINQDVIASEQEMADAFAANGLVPEKFDVEPYFIDDFNPYTTGKG